MKIAVVEDDARYREQADSFLHRYAQEHALSFEISMFTDGAAIADGYRPVYDIIFLDIEMPHLDGMKTAQIAREINARGLYARRDGQPVTDKQVYAVIMSHPETFVKSEGRIRLMI